MNITNATNVTNVMNVTNVTNVTNENPGALSLESLVDVLGESAESGDRQKRISYD